MATKNRWLQFVQDYRLNNPNAPFSLSEISKLYRTKYPEVAQKVANKNVYSGPKYNCNVYKTKDDCTLTKGGGGAFCRWMEGRKQTKSGNVRKSVCAPKPTNSRFDSRLYSLESLD